MLIGYMRVSKADGSQTLDLQRDALLARRVEPGHLYEDQASGKRDNRPGLKACLKALRAAVALTASLLIGSAGATFAQTPGGGTTANRTDDRDTDDVDWVEN